MARFVLKSPAFQNDGLIARLHTCDGKDRSPPLSWDGVPEKTVAFALIVEDPDAPRKTWIHWVLFDLPASETALAEGIPPRGKLEGGGLQGLNDFGKLGYGGPCPPSGIHRYVFTLWALDRLLGLESGAACQQVRAAMEGHVLGQARLVGRYGRDRAARP